MTWKHWFGLLVAIAIVAWLVAFSRVEAQERLFTPDDHVDPTVMEAYRTLDYPSRAAFGEGLILRWEGRMAFHAVGNGPLRNVICPPGTVLGCIEWVDNACVIHYDVALHDERYAVVMDVLMPRLIADCGLTRGRTQ